MSSSVHSGRIARLPLPVLNRTAIVGLALALVGCGGSSVSGVAHLSATTRSGTAAPHGTGSPPAGASPQQAGIAFAKCMRENGVPDFPDPDSNGNFRVKAGMDPSSPAFRTARAKCHTLMPGGGPPSKTNPSPQTLARFLKIAQCMRKDGVYDFPDPRTSVPPNAFGSSRGGVISDIEEVIFVFPSTIDQQSPAFERAAAVCAFPLHNH